MYSPRVRKTPHFQDEFSRFFLFLQLRMAPTQRRTDCNQGYRTTLEQVKN